MPSPPDIPSRILFSGPRRPAFSPLSRGVGWRLAVTGGVLAGLWLAVAWALAD